MSLQQKEADSDVESEEASEWLLGFVEPPRKRTDLLRHRFPSKVGGRPAWLDPLYLPTEEQLTCRVTGKPLDFLLQVPSRAATRRVVHEPTFCYLSAVAEASFMHMRTTILW
jgi:pre-rRNA-processing protein TSR4